MAEQFGQFLGNLIPRSGQLDPTGLRQGIMLGGLIGGQLNIDQSQALLDMLEREPRFVPNSTEQIAGSARKGPNERRPNGD